MMFAAGCTLTGVVSFCLKFRVLGRGLERTSENFLSSFGWKWYMYILVDLYA